MHFRSLANAIRVLRHFRSLFGRERETTDVLVACCQDINTRPYEREVAIHAIGSLQLSSDYTNQTLLELLQNTTNSYERAGMYAYFIESNQVDEFIDFFLDGITKKSISTGASEYGSESFRLNEGLNRISKPFSIRKALDFFAQHEERINLFRDRELIESIVSKAVSLYLDGYSELYSSVYNALLTSLKKHYHGYIKEFWSFFVSIGEKISAFEKIISIESARRNFYYEGLMDDDCISFMAEQYKNGKHKIFFIDIVGSLTEDHPMFSTCQCLIQQTDDISVQSRKIVNYLKLEQQGRQLYFNALFDKEKYDELIHKLIAISKSENLSYKELKELHHLRTEDNHDLDLVKWDLIRATDDKDSHLPIKDFLARINWDWFSIYQTYKLLESHNRASITISALQKEHIKKYCDRILSEITFSKSVTYSENRGWSCSWESVFASFFIQYFDLPCDDKMLYDLLLYPNLYEFDENGGFRSSYNHAMPFLEQRLTKEKLIAQVKHNVLNCQLSSPILERHLAYCKDHKISDAIPLATSICKSNDDEYIKLDAFHYLLTVVDEEYIYQNILPYSDNRLLTEIAQSYIQSRDVRLINKLLECTRDSQDPLLFLSYLIRLQSSEGLRIYYEIARALNMIPDYSGENSAHPNGATEAIQCIHKINLLPQLIQLAKLRFRPNFKDAGFDSLYSGLCKSFAQIGKVSNYDTVNSALNTLMDAEPHNLELRAFCYYIIEDIKEQEAIENIRVWDIKNIKSILNNR